MKAQEGGLAGVEVVSECWGGCCKQRQCLGSDMMQTPAM